MMLLRIHRTTSPALLLFSFTHFFHSVASFVTASNHHQSEPIKPHQNKNNMSSNDSMCQEDTVSTAATVWDEAIEGMIHVPGYSEREVLYLAPAGTSVRTKKLTSWPPPFQQNRRVYCLTGHNPNGQDAPKEFNIQANISLNEKLNKSRHPPYYGRWNSFGFHVTENWREDGFAVSFDSSNITTGRSFILDLAREFHQAAIYEWFVDNDGELMRQVIWCDNREDNDVVKMGILENIPNTDLATGEVR